MACWYSFLHASGIATCDPFAGIERPPRRRPADEHYLQAEHLQDLLAWAATHESKRTQAWLGLLIGTACSADALQRSSLRDLTRAGAHHRLHLRSSDSTQRQRIYDLGPYVSGLLSAYLRERGRAGGPLFVTSHWAPLQPSYTGELVRRIARQAAIPQSGPLSPSVLRRSVANALIRAGESPAVIRALQGRTAEGDIDRAVIYSAALHRWDARLSAGVAPRMRRHRR
ncbi:hypothetical protein ACTMTF_42830 [Nonomuraea sp. ZG12]|uniref:hypothetical protein n=1 Tax=Nonomuraea sp. ZG12 TaxID=3452207 RepID=UPI003F89D4B0